MNKRTKKDTKSFPSKNKKFKEKLFLPKKENEAKDFNTNDNNDQIKLESKNIFDENYLIDFRNNMKTKFKLTKSITYYKKINNNKKNINQKTIEAITSKNNKTISKNKSIKKGKNLNKKINNNKTIENNTNNENKNGNNNENNNLKNKDNIIQNNNKNSKDNTKENNNPQKIQNDKSKNNISDNNNKIINISKNTKNTSKINESDNNNKNKNKDNISDNNIKIINSNNDKNNKTRKSNIKKRKSPLFPKKNVGIKLSESSPVKSKDKNNTLGKSNKLHNIIIKNKETISTNVETLSIEKEKNEEKEEEKNNEILKAHFTPIPSLLRRTSKIISGQIPNVKDVEKAINLRRQQYNEYLRNLNKPKPKPKPKPKVYDLDNVIFIQKMYKGFQIKDVNHTVTRLKINLCVTELLCLILNNVFKHARRRITFYMFKTYYHDPFTHIFTEVNFTDKLAMKLSDTYYNFNNFY